MWNISVLMVLLQDFRLKQFVGQIYYVRHVSDTDVSHPTAVSFGTGMERCSNSFSINICSRAGLHFPLSSQYSYCSYLSFLSKACHASNKSAFLKSNVESRLLHLSFLVFRNCLVAMTDCYPELTVLTNCAEPRSVLTEAVNQVLEALDVCVCTVIHYQN